MLTPRRILGAVFALALAACAGGEGESPHAGVACVGCHREGVSPATRYGVPDRSCTTSGCHPDGGPDSVQIRMVTFDHRAHPSRDSAAVPCASCHIHRPDSVTLTAGTASCTLCHSTDIAGRTDAACANCHPSPMHTRTTSEGLALPHEQLRDANVSCTRCHYRLLEGSVAVPLARCAACHESKDLPAPAQLLQPDSAHRQHREFSCSACHERMNHRVVAMSSTVQLDCLECHALRHNPPIPADTLPDSTCGECHRNIHQDAQRMILGVLPGQPAEPSAMFMGGVTCRSCHVVPGQTAPRPGTSRRGSAAACTGCHGGAWNDVLARWNRGYGRRRDMVRAYLRAARSALGDSAAPAARGRLAQADQLLEFVDRGGPLHNLPVTDQMLRRALALGGEAYAAGSRRAPAEPLLGPPVVTGTCISCHYGVEEAPVGIDSATGRRATHADHLFRAGLSCDNCHAVGAAPPGFAGDSSGLFFPGRDTVRTPAAAPRP